MSFDIAAFILIHFIGSGFGECHAFELVVGFSTQPSAFASSYDSFFFLCICLAWDPIMEPAG
jgi:hypothetical protein